MASAATIAILVVLIAILIISIFFYLVPAIFKMDAIGFNSDPDLAEGHKYIVWALILAIVTGIYVGSLFFVYVDELLTKTGGTGKFPIVLAYIGAIMTLVTGILAAVGATYVKRSSSVSNTTVYHDSVMATVFLIVSSGLILLFGLIMIFVGRGKPATTAVGTTATTTTAVGTTGPTTKPPATKPAATTVEKETTTTKVTAH